MTTDITPEGSVVSIFLDPTPPAVDPAATVVVDFTQLRLAAIQTEAMPLWLIWQMDTENAEAEQAWRDKMLEIEERFAV